MQLIYCNEESPFCNIIPEHGETFPFLARVQKVRRGRNRTFFFCIRNHSRTATSTSSLLWNRRIPKRCRSPIFSVLGVYSDTKTLAKINHNSRKVGNCFPCDPALYRKTKRIPVLYCCPSLTETATCLQISITFSNIFHSKNRLAVFELLHSDTYTHSDDNMTKISKI